MRNCLSGSPGVLLTMQEAESTVPRLASLWRIFAAISSQRLQYRYQTSFEPRCCCCFILGKSWPILPKIYCSTSLEKSSRPLQWTCGHQ